MPRRTLFAMRLWSIARYNAWRTLGLLSGDLVLVVSQNTMAVPDQRNLWISLPSVGSLRTRAISAGWIWSVTSSSLFSYAGRLVRNGSSVSVNVTFCSVGLGPQYRGFATITSSLSCSHDCSLNIPLPTWLPASTHFLSYFSTCQRGTGM